MHRSSHFRRAVQNRSTLGGAFAAAEADYWTMHQGVREHNASAAGSDTPTSHQPSISRDKGSSSPDYLHSFAFSDIPVRYGSISRETGQTARVVMVHWSEHVGSRKTFRQASSKAIQTTVDRFGSLRAFEGSADGNRMGDVIAADIGNYIPTTEAEEVGTPKEVGTPSRM